MEEAFLKLLLALILGASIGLEREMKKKEAGLQTYSLVCFSSCLFAIVAFSLAKLKIIDSSLIIMAIAVGMGFIGAGAIFKSENKVLGLTTAAGLWGTAALGLTVASGFYYLAVFSTFLILTILAGFGFLEEKIFKK